GGAKWSGKILAPQPGAAAATAATFVYGAAAAPPPSGLVLVETADGTKALPIERIEGVTFKGAAKTAVDASGSRDLLTLHLAWKGERAAKARVGIACLENGLRWIPSYRIDVDGAGRAHVRLEATIVDDLADLDHAAVHLV